MPEGTSKAIEPRQSAVLKWSELSAQATLPAIQRRWRLIALVVVTIMVLAGLALWLIPPRYTSEMTLLFETKRNLLAPTDIETMMEGNPQVDPVVIGEIEVIQSRDLAKQVINKLALDEDPEFAVTPPEEGDFIGEILYAVKNFLLPGTHGEEGVIDTFLDHLRVSQVTGSPAVDVRFRSNDPEKSAKILATIAESFMVSRLEDRVQNAKWVGNWLAERIQDMRTQVERAERDVAQYRKLHGLVAGERTALINERISKLNIELADAVAARQTAEAQLQQAKRTLQRPESVNAVNRVIDSELIQRLRQRQVELEQRAAELGETLGSRHPQMIQMQAERQKLASEVRAEISRLADTFDYQARVARAREQGLNQQLEMAKQELGTADQASVGLRTLEREADSSRLVLERFMNLVPQISAQSDLQAVMPNTRIISTANVPDSPSFPQPIPLLAVSLLASLGLGVLLALLADHFDRQTFVSAEEVEATTRLPVLTLVPLIRASRWDDIAQRVLEPHHSVFAEAISALFTRMVLTYRTHNDVPGGRTDIKSIAFTSCEPREGKSTVALALARQQARCGRRVLLLDADFTLSRLAGYADLPVGSPGLAEVLLGDASIDEAVQTDRKSPLEIILPGRATIDHAAFATSPRIQDIIAELCERYDLVVIDTQPIIATAHAYQFASAADMSLMVIRWGHTPRRQVAYVLHQLDLLGCTIDALVLSMVDLGKNRRYGYGDSRYYSRKASQYYAKESTASS